MDKKISTEQEFEVLGFKLRPKAEDGQLVDAQRVIELVQKEAMEIQKKHKNLDNGQVAILVSLKLAADKLTLEHECKNTLQQMKLTAQDALQLVDELSPPSMS